LGVASRYRHDDPFVGTGYSNEDIRAALEECKVSYRVSNAVCEDTAELLHQGRIVGWFQGRMEFGARALGNRSILANPTIENMKDKLNLQVKHRESFRPFAPSIPVAFKDDYFEAQGESPFML